MNQHKKYTSLTRLLPTITDLMKVAVAPRGELTAQETEGAISFFLAMHAKAIGKDKETFISDLSELIRDNWEAASMIVDNSNKEG